MEHGKIKKGGDKKGGGRSPLRRSLIQVAVMLGCFYLYYLGLFGGVEGPLSADSIAGYLDSAGVGRTGFIYLLVFLVAVTAGFGTWLSVGKRKA